jgi:hypothetical protein
MAVSYNLDLSTEHSVMRRKLIQSEWFQRLWGDRFEMSGDRNQVGQFMNDRGGQMIATSVGATAWGRGCDTAILDDPLSADQALSVTERTTANNWMVTTLPSRLNDPPTGAIILVMQRLHELDPTGFLLEQEPSIWPHTRIPLGVSDIRQSGSALAWRRIATRAIYTGCCRRATLTSFGLCRTISTKAGTCRRQLHQTQ